MQLSVREVIAKRRLLTKVRAFKSIGVVWIIGFKVETNLTGVKGYNLQGGKTLKKPFTWNGNVDKVAKRRLVNAKDTQPLEVILRTCP